jgi:alkylation response protein AidB-like acyl-CoA dehydrogenase
MDFSYTDEQQAIIDLARRLFGERSTHERQKAIERAAGPRFDPELWGEAAKAGLLGIAVPERFGGAGLGFLELSAIIEQVGRTTAPIPLLETTVLGALPIAEFGADHLRAAILPRVVTGDAVLTAALVEPGDDPLLPATRAVADGGGWRLDGVKICVPAAQLAEHILVPAATAGGVGVFVVASAAGGVRIESLDTTSGQPEALVELRGARVGSSDVVGEPTQGAAILAWMIERATAASCALALGVCEEALRLTAEYTKTREQFGVPLASFQAVGHRVADAYVDTEAIRLTAWQAAWRIAAGLPAAAAVAVAKFWTAEAGQRVVHAAQHLHGGIGVDRDYPLHRYFLYAKQIELTLGGATHQLRALGRMLAAPAPDHGLWS